MRQWRLEIEEPLYDIPSRCSSQNCTREREPERRGADGGDDTRGREGGRVGWAVRGEARTGGKCHMD
ncbi:hypothetical protein E2C01_067738 [Portunus trituberculatus]|uniref:Uncharacterized protein n=1 Tax=Portunus trituberculatus TaxID=210409 RepID=A0A5B7HLV0_PORTR|nr:hypothetical protein [Portunus trituberculatus]